MTIEYELVRTSRHRVKTNQTSLRTCYETLKPVCLVLEVFTCKRGRDPRLRVQSLQLGTIIVESNIEAEIDRLAIEATKV